MVKSGILAYCIFVLFLRPPAFADTAADISEDSTASGIPERETAAQTGLHGLIGAGMFSFEKIVGDGGRRIFPLPIVIAAYDSRLYMSIASVGIWLLRSDDRTVRFGAGLKARPGWNPDDDPLLQGMASRDNSADGYVNALFRSPVVNVSAVFYHDLGNVSNGNAATLRLSHNFWINRITRITPSIGIEWLSSRLVDFYYGVRPSEARTDRPAYQGRESVDISAGVTGGYHLTRRWSLLGGVYARRFGSGIHDSPIVTRSVNTLAFFGAGMTF